MKTDIQTVLDKTHVHTRVHFLTRKHSHKTSALKSTRVNVRIAYKYYIYFFYTRKKVNYIKNIQQHGVLVILANYCTFALRNTRKARCTRIYTTGESYNLCIQLILYIETIYILRVRHKAL